MMSIQGSQPAAKPTFRQTAVTSGVLVASGAVDLKTAACFYDHVVIMDYERFTPSLRETLGQDLGYLVDEGIVSLRSYDEILAMKSDHQAFGYAESIRSYMMSSIFAEDDERPPIHEVAGNGMARLYAALALETSQSQCLVPIVSSRMKIDGYTMEVALDDTPLPLAEKIEALLPVRTTAAEALFNLIPMPSREVPWQDVTEFRADHKTALYAARIRILLERLSKETDRRHVEDLILSEFATFENDLRIAKMKTQLGSFKAVLPFGDMIGDILGGMLKMKFGETVKGLVEMRERQIDVSEAEAKIQSDPYYMIEHVRSTLA